VGILANGIAFVPSTFIQAAGRPDITAKLSLVELPLYAVLAFILIQAYGIVGAAIAIDIRFIVDAIALMVLAKPVMATNDRTFIDRPLPRPLVHTESQILE
jgi:Na+-driven multidrug efflux pump